MLLAIFADTILACSFPWIHPYIMYIFITWKIISVASNMAIISQQEEQKFTYWVLLLLHLCVWKC